MERRGREPEVGDPLAEHLEQLRLEPQPDDQPTLFPVATYHEGPLPPAHEMAAYEAAIPGAGRDILDMAKETLSTRNQVMLIGAKTERFVSTLGVIAAVVLTLGAFAAAAFFAYRGQGWVAAVFISFPAAAMIRVLVTSRQKKPPPEQEQEQASDGQQ